MLLAAKFTRPGHAAAVVDRPRLYRRLESWRALRALAIFAPAGYGKSSLVSRWLDVTGVSAQAAWLSLDEGDVDPTQFVQYVAAALDTVRAGATEIVRPMLAGLEDDPGTPGRALDRLLSALPGLAPADATDPHVLLVLDDLHCVEDPAVDALVMRMLEHGPPTLHLLLLSRERTSLALARLYAHGAIATLTAEDLRFSEEEISTFLQRRGFAAPNATEVARLAQRSEGWVTALQLAVLAVRRPGDIGELIDALRGDRDWQAEFLTAEVLTRQTPALRRFLLETSLLDEFNAALCAAVTGDDAAQAHIAALARADLFLIRLDYEQGWYRYHSLFQELLRHRLEVQMGQTGCAAIHRRAAAWLAEVGRVPAAVKHLLAAGDDNAAAELVEESIRTGAVRLSIDARRLVDQLPANAVRRRPRLLLDRCFMAVVFDEPKMPLLVEQARTVLGEQPRATCQMQAIYGEWLVLRSAVSFREGDLVATGNYLTEAVAYRENMRDLIAGTYEFIQMHLLRYSGRDTAASVHAERALEAFVRADFAIGTLALRRELANWSMRSGRSREATQRFEDLFEARLRQQLPATYEIIFAYIMASENSYWQNKLAQADVYLNEARALATQVQDNESLETANCMGAFLAAGKQGRASKTAAWKVTPTQAPMTASAEWQLFYKTHAFVVAGRGDLAHKCVRQAGIELLSLPVKPVRLPLLAGLYAQIAAGVELDSVTVQLAEALRQSEEAGHRLYELHLLVLTAWQQLRMAGKQAAIPMLRKAAQLAQETGYVRVVLDIPDLVALLPATGDPLLMTELAGETPLAGAELTPTERKVLKLLAADYKYEQIAAELVIGVNTVRTHVSTIYRKLGVHRRLEAIEVAERWGVLG